MQGRCPAFKRFWEFFYKRSPKTKHFSKIARTSVPERNSGIGKAIRWNSFVVGATSLRWSNVAPDFWWWRWFQIKKPKPYETPFYRCFGSFRKPWKREPFFRELFEKSSLRPSKTFHIFCNFVAKRHGCRAAALLWEGFRDFLQKISQKLGKPIGGACKISVSFFWRVLLGLKKALY